MSDYFNEADPRRVIAEYPIGAEFLAGPASLGRDELRALQERRFLEVIRRGWQVPFYRRLWNSRGIEPGDIAALEDISKLPTFSKSDLMASVAEHPPFGDYHGIDFGHSDRLGAVLHTTSGTTGTPQPLFFGAWDREVQNVLLARTYRLQGLGDDDVVHSVYGFGMVNGGHYIREAVLHFTKALLLPAGTGNETRSEQQVRLMRLYGVNVIVGFVDYIKHLAEVAREAGLEPGRDIPIRLISCHLGQESRNAVAEAWGGGAVYDWYGVGDTGSIAAEGPARDGQHVWEDAHLVEIIDPDSLDPLDQGIAGNICVTCLYKTGVYPVIRFNTNDMSRLLPPAPESGINFRRLEGFLGRSDNMVKLRGVNVYPTAVAAHLAKFDEATGEYVCRLQRTGNREELIVMVEVHRGLEGSADLQRRIATALGRQLGVEVEVALVSPGETATLTQVTARQKPIRLVDERP